MIEVHDLTKRFGDKVAVDHLTFTVKPGRVTGFLGPNGAGKSTTMRLILGLDRPNDGTATINGQRYADLVNPLRTVGALLEAKSVHNGRSARNHLLFLAQTQGLPASRVDAMLDLVGLRPVARKRAGGFSLGMNQRLGVAAAMLGDPQVLLLDEPVNGLDPEGVLWIRNLMKGLASQGRTILVSSHLMNEMAVTADHLIVIGKGRLLADAATEEVIARSSGHMVRVRTPEPERLITLVKAEGGSAVTSADGGNDEAVGAPLLTVTGLPAARIGELAASSSVVLHELTPQLASLEDAFLELTAGSLEYGHADNGHADSPARRRPARRRPARRKERPVSAPAASLPAPRAARQGRQAGFGHYLLSEWTKIRSVRSTPWTLAFFVVASLGLTALFTWLTVHQIQAGHADRRGADILADPVAFILGTGLSLGQLAICVLGVLTMTTEYSTGVIRASLLAVPKRLPLLTAKALVFAAIVFVIGEIAAFCSFFIGKPLVHPLISVSLSQPGVTRSVIGAGLYLTVLGLFALAIGALIRHTGGAIAIVIFLVLIVPGLLGLLDSYWWGAHIHAWYPVVAGSYITADHQQADQLLSPWQGFAVFCGWTALLMTAAAWLLHRRDA